MTDTFARDHLPPREQWPVLREMDYPSELNAASELLSGWDDRPCVLAEETWTYAELAERAGAIARTLVEEHGLEPGNRVLLHGFNDPQLIAGWFGVLLAGGVAVATMPMLRAGELTKVIEKAQVSHALVDARLAGEVHGVREVRTLDDLPSTGAFEPVATSRDDVALIAFTSGTTGEPKGCVHFHRDVLAICDTFAREILDPVAGGRLHRHGAAGVHVRARRARAVPDALRGVVRADRRRRASTRSWRPSRVTASRRSPPRRPCTARSCAPTRSSAPCAPASPPASRSRRASRRPGTSGPASASSTASARRRCCTSSSPPGRRTRSSAPSARPCRATRPAWWTSPWCPVAAARSGAWPCAARPAAATSTIRGRRTTSSTGGTSPGDSFRVDEDGYFWFEARNDDLIVSSGYNISPFEVETTLLEHDAVAECAVVASPDEARGHVVKAFVVLASTA